MTEPCTSPATLGIPYFIICYGSDFHSLTWYSSTWTGASLSLGVRLHLQVTILVLTC